MHHSPWLQWHDLASFFTSLTIVHVVISLLPCALIWHIKTGQEKYKIDKSGWYFLNKQRTGDIITYHPIVAKVSALIQPNFSSTLCRSGEWGDHVTLQEPSDKVRNVVLNHVLLLTLNIVHQYSLIYGFIGNYFTPWLWVNLCANCIYMVFMWTFTWNMYAVFLFISNNVSCNVGFIPGLSSYIILQKINFFSLEIILQKINFFLLGR